MNWNEYIGKTIELYDTLCEQAVTFKVIETATNFKSEEFIIVRRELSVENLIINFEAISNNSQTRYIFKK